MFRPNITWPLTTAIVMLAVAAVAALLFRSAGEAEEGAPIPPPPALPHSELPATKPQAHLPATVVSDVVANQANPVHTAAPCAGCLDEQAVLDVAGGYLFYVMPDHLGTRAERYIVSIPPNDEELEQILDTPRPALPPGLLNAPPISPFGMNVQRPGSPSEALETWIIWIQTGWQSRSTLESLVERDELPEVALSWPPLKREHYLLVNARTGELTSVEGILGHLDKVDPRGMNLHVLGREEARKRAAAWFATDNPPEH